MGHDVLCENYNGSCCPWMGDCECQCMCDFIGEVRLDTINNIQYAIDEIRSKID